MTESKVIPATEEELATLVTETDGRNKIVPMSFGLVTGIDAAHPQAGWALNRLAEMRGIPRHKIRRQVQA